MLFEPEISVEKKEADEENTKIYLNESENNGDEHDKCFSKK